MRRRAILLLAAISAGLVLSSVVAVAAEPYGTLDANTLDAGSNYSYGLRTETGQTFVPKHSGQVTSVQLKLYDAFPEAETWDGLDLTLYSVPDPSEPLQGGMYWAQNLLSSGQVSPSEVSATPTLVTAELSGPGTVRAGHHYAITARQPVMQTYGWEAHHNGNDPSTDIYPDGIVVRSSTQDWGGPFYRHTSTDFVFAVYINQRPVVADLAPAPGSKTGVHRPTIAATVNDPETDLTGANISLFLDGKRIGADAFNYDAGADRLTYRPPKRLPSGKHAVKVVATDERDFAKEKRWRFEIR